MTTVSQRIVTTVAAALGHWTTQLTHRPSLVAMICNPDQLKPKRDKPRWLARNKGDKLNSIEGCTLVRLWVINLRREGCILLKLLRVLKLSRSSKDRGDIDGLQQQVERLIPTISLCSMVAGAMSYLSMTCTIKITMMSLIMEASMVMKIRMVSS